MAPHAVARHDRFYLALAAVTFGVATSVVNHGYGPASAYTSKVLGSDFAWAAAVALVATTGHSWRDSFRRCMTFVVPAVVAYYSADIAFGTYTAGSSPVPGSRDLPTGFDAAGAVSDTVAYLVLGAIASAALSMLAVLISRGGFVGLVALEVTPACIAYLAFVRASRVFPPDAVEERTIFGMGVAALVVAVAAGGWYCVRWRDEASGASHHPFDEGDSSTIGSSPTRA